MPILAFPARRPAAGLRPAAASAGASFPRRMLRLALPFWASPDSGRAKLLVVLLIGVKLATTWIALRQNAWYNAFYTALQGNDSAAFKAQVAAFGLIAAGFVACLIFGHRLAESIKLQWRDWMVRRYMGDWMAHRAFFRLQLENRASTDPDQRITEDMGIFAGQTLDLIVGVLDVAVSLVSFTAVLWALSGSLDVFGVSVPGYMVLAVFAYSIAASVVTHLIGNPLIGLHSANRTLEADFRFGLIRLRENAETVAFYRGEDRESGILGDRWGRVVSNFRSILKSERRLAWFTHSYTQASIVIPFLLASPRYFAGELTFGQVMQVAAAFGAVQACLNFFINSYPRIAEWKATTDRLTTFRDDLDAIHSTAVTPLTVAQGSRLAVRDLHLDLPNARPLISGVELTAEPGEAILIKAPSGTGKSTVLRAIAGIWPYGRGSVEVAPGSMLFIPQKPYMPLGTLREAAFYPEAPSADDLEVVRALKAVNLGHLIGRLDEVDHWSHRLSGGEQQRLAFARVLLTQPGTVFLDEATSALDEAGEALMYTLLRDAAWKPTIVSIGHRGTLTAYHDRVVNLVPNRLAANENAAA